MNEGATVVISGASSFVGAHVAHYLAGKGLRIFAAHSRPIESYSGIQAERLDFASETGAEFICLDLADSFEAAATMEKIRPDFWICHTGWHEPLPRCSPDCLIDEPVSDSSYDTIFKALMRVGCRGVLVTGCAAEYGRDRQNCKEDDAPSPRDAGGLASLMRTLRFQQLAKTHDIPVRVARLSTPFGILDRADSVLDHSIRQLSAGRSVTIPSEEDSYDLISVRDIGRGYLNLLHDFERRSLFEIFNISRGATSTVGPIARRIAEILGTDGSLVRASEASRPTRAGPSASNEKARGTIHWRPDPLEDSLQSYVTQFAEYHSRPSIRPRRTRVRLSRSSVNEKDINKVGIVLRRAMLGMGSEVAAFESELCSFIGGEREVLCVSTGTAALQLALQAVGAGPGDEVLVSTLTYVASFQAITATGATPVACDVRLEDGGIDPAEAERRITPRTKAIMPVHYASGLGALEEIYDLAQKYKLRVVEDAAHAFGCTFRGARVGSFGDIVCFSFDGIKNITAGEGGAVITSDHDVAAAIRNARLLGVENDTQKRYAGQRSWDFEVSAQGWRYHMSNINAALGRSQLARFETDFAPARVRSAQRYVEALEGLPVRLLGLEYGPIVPHIFPILVAAAKRDAAREALRDAGIESGIHYKPNHLLAQFGAASISLPRAEKLYGQLLTLPLHVELTSQDQDRVVGVLAGALS